ncbi:hypothetical protein Msil_1566 [Methylocella silvestris BL2]|uniref:Uncharacterized protein n=1 Tax=Methylocella silvestris (strain DSM 15510 / CIP 108128 / LMG 27833 / NCIMB 13906 / BL2) TaxID=395965 RepID=B8EI34_METSB|nr:hypothetical protein [Methylocella silvestris]ACK50516.1 hypothetical protein Msil_1566 [Methylocella silvestris BL2]
MIVEAALVVHIAEFLCDSRQTAVLFEDRLVEQPVAELAANDLAREAGKQVCGFYSGDAAVASETRVIIHGVVYLITEFVFDTDHRMAMSAQRVFDARARSGEQDL